MARGSTDGQEVESPDSVLGGTTVEVGESMASVDSSSRTPKRRILELAMRIGHRPMRVLVDCGSTGNYINAQECATQRTKIRWKIRQRNSSWQMVLWLKLRDEFSSYSNVVGTEVKFPPGYFPI